MRPLSEIVASVRLGEEVDHNELRYAVAAFDVLLARLKLEERPKMLYEYFVAADLGPDEYLGKPNSPDDPEAREWYRAMHSAGRDDGEPGPA